VAEAVAMHEILANTGSGTRLLTASIRSAQIVVDLARRGLDTFTFGTAVAEELLASGLTAGAAADFQRAADAMGEDR
jgi:transaldolase